MYRSIVILGFALGASLTPAVAAPAVPDQHQSGRITSVERSAVTLVNRRTIFLKRGTRIEPRGRRLQPGQTIVVQGALTEDGNLDATAIRILGRAYALGPGFGSWYGGRDDLVATGLHASRQSRGTAAHRDGRQPKGRR